MIQWFTKKTCEEKWQIAMDQAMLCEDEDAQAPWWQAPESKCGTQHIDRCWKFIKERLVKGSHVRAGSICLHRKIRSAQYEYWHRGDDMWVCTGELVSAYVSEIVA